MKNLKLTFCFLMAFTTGTLVYGQNTNNTFNGYNAGISNTSGDANTFVGSAAGRQNTEGSKNTFVGRQSGLNNTVGTQNTFVGVGSGAANNAHNNTFVGHLSGHHTTSGEANTFIGLNAGQKNTEGYENTYLGFQSGFQNLTGYHNVCLGAYAGNKNTGSKNVYIGRTAGNTNTSGSSNVFIGYAAGYYETGSNKLHIASTANNTLIYGEFDNRKVGINTTTPENELDVCGVIRGTEVKVQSGWCDFVFEEDYQLKSLEEEEAYVEENGYLSGFESEEEMEGEIQLGDVTFRQQQKIEEMMLHLFEINKQMTKMKTKIELLEEENAKLKEEAGR